MSDQDRAAGQEEQKQNPDAGKKPEKRVKSLQDIRKRKSRRKRIIFLAVLVLAVGGGYFFFSSRQQQAAEAALAAAQASAEYTVDSRMFREEVEISGNVMPVKSENLFFRTSGEVKEVFAEEGDLVEKGDPVAKLRLQAKELELAQLEYDIEQARFAGSRKQIELLEMRRELVLEDISNAYLRAGISGVVSRVTIEAGDIVGSSVSEPAVRIIDNSSFKATVEVDEFDINAVRVGQSAELVFDALGSGTVVKGRVSSIPLEGSVTGQGIAVKNIELIIDDPPASVSPSYTFSGVIVAGDRQQVLTFPQDFVVRDNSTQRVIKKTGDAERTSVEVSTVYFESGLVRLVSGDIAEGDVIIRQAARSTGMSSPFAIGGPPGGRR